MSHTQDKAHSSAILGAILEGEKAQEQQRSRNSASDSASVFSTSSFGSAKALLKKHGKSKPEKSSSGPSSAEAELVQAAQRNQHGRQLHFLFDEWTTEEPEDSWK
ncbi:hypothetical protein F4804DRAFT_329789 [Jackrogersella minutella]|nr:hypothetical protein F4804DRAFT_329789 [Jackrogersella minutella]